MSTATFAELGLNEQLLSAVTALGYTTPTPVQAATIPPLLLGRDVMGLAATGTGKTAAFALPMLQRLEPGRLPQGMVKGLVLAPTRELALQVTEAIKKLGASRGLSVLAVYGGSDITAQMKKLRSGVDVVVATPGRALDHIRRKTMILSKVQLVVLDEADEMLDLGFAEDLETILKELPETRQTALFSATLPSRIATLGEKYLKDPVRVRLERPRGDDSKPRIVQRGYVVSFPHKAVALRRVLELERPPSAIVFCRTREDVEGVGTMLEQSGHSVSALHGGLSQEQRDRVMKRFKERTVSILVATDVAARGLDVDHVTHVVNLDLPHTVESYVHRIGRTGRAGRAGTAVSFILPKERHLVPRLEQATQGTLTILPVPAMREVRAHRLAQLETQLTERLATPATDASKALIEKLKEAGSLEDIAAAALVALSEALHPPSDDDDVEIPLNGPKKGDFKKRPDAPFSRERSSRPADDSRRPPRNDARPTGTFSAPRPDGPQRGDKDWKRPGKDEARAPKVSAPRARPVTEQPDEPRRSAPRSRPTEVASAPEAAREAAPRVSAPRGSAPRTSEARTSEARTSEARTSAPRVSAPRSGQSPAFRASASKDRVALKAAPRTDDSVGRPSEARTPKTWKPGDRSPAPRGSGKAMTRLFFGLGKVAGIRPQDFVGAIANEAGIPSTQIGAISIADHHTFVEVEATVAEQVVTTMRSAKIRGRAVRVDRDRSFKR